MYRKDKAVTVYASDRGRVCPGCGQAAARCQCRRQEASSRGGGVARVSRSTKGRGGKCVSLVAGLALGHDELRQLAGRLKHKCGSGGTVKDGVIEIQGDHRDTVLAELARQGIRAKRAGG